MILIVESLKDLQLLTKGDCLNIVDIINERALIKIILDHVGLSYERLQDWRPLFRQCWRSFAYILLLKYVAVSWVAYPWLFVKKIGAGIK